MNFCLLPGVIVRKPDEMVIENVTQFPEDSLS